jgi:hypothetical protein
MFDCVLTRECRNRYREEFGCLGCHWLPECLVCSVEACRVFVSYCNELGLMREDYVNV